MSEEPFVFHDPLAVPTEFPAVARTHDIVSAVLAGLIAGVVSLLPTGSIVWNVMMHTPADSAAALMLATLWNLMVLGPALYGVGSWWLWSTRQRGLTDRSFLWRVYGKVQWVTLMLLPALSILFCGICSAVTSFSLH